MRSMARPSSYSTEVADSICQRLASGEALYRICDSPELPSTPTVFKWLSERPEFLSNYARAREAQAELMAEEILRIADSADAESYNAARLQVDARKWLMSKTMPKKYGDATMLKHADANGEPFKIEVTRVMPKATRILEIEAAKDDSDEE